MSRAVREPRPRTNPILRLLGHDGEVPRDEQFDNSGAQDVERPDVEEAKKEDPTALLRLLGPGIVTVAADDDPSAIGSYSQAGAQAGLGMLWTPVLMLPLMMAVQELAQRIALQTDRR